MDEHLIHVLNTVGKSPERYQSPDGSEVLILPYGGRILGLYPADSDKNFYWTNPAVAAIDTAKSFFESRQWQNTGGDRTWLAPEIDFFFPNFPDRSVYFQPRQLDPGAFVVTCHNERLVMKNEFTIIPSRSREEIALRITKSLAPAAHPLRYERDIDDLLGVQYAGYTLYTSLEMLNETALLGCAGLWNLVQMPHNGKMLIPTISQSEPKICFGNIPAGDIKIEEHLVTYSMRAAGEQKISLRAVTAIGRVGYFYQSDKECNLIIRNFVVNPSGEYIDVLWNDTDYLGFAVQACNVSSNLGSFSELEYHIPAIGKGTGKARCDDAAQVWAFRGEYRDIAAIAQMLLGAKI